jgi:phage pi2 protein 07
MTSINIEGTFSIIGYILAVVAGIIIIFGRVRNQNYKDLKDRVKILEDDRKAAITQHLENQKAISNLEGQLSTYKEVPLKSISESLKALTKSNQNIENILSKSALVSELEAHDGGLLVKTKATV